jgi:hypothetical protein
VLPYVSEASGLLGRAVLPSSSSLAKTRLGSRTEYLPIRERHLRRGLYFFTTEWFLHFEPDHCPRSQFPKNIRHPSWGSDADEKLPRPIVCLKDSVLFRRAQPANQRVQRRPMRVYRHCCLAVGTSITIDVTLSFGQVLERRFLQQSRKLE